MRKAAGLVLILLCLAILVHDAASERFRTFRKLQDERYLLPFFNALRNRDLSEARRLLKMAGLNTQGLARATPLHLAAITGETAIAESLIQKGAEVDARAHDSMTPLHWAAMNRQLGTAQILITNGADRNARDGSGQTPLHLAVRPFWATGNMVSFTQLLLTNGVDLNVKDTCHKTPLDIAEDRGQTQIADLLRQHGAKTGKELDE